MSNRGTLYFNPNKIEATLFEGVRRNLPMFHKDLKIYRGVDNNIQFELKNSDRQPLKMFNRTLKCIILNPFNQELMLTRYLYNTNEQKGIYTLYLTPGDVQEWSAGFYTFSVLMTDECGSEELFYTTLDQEVTGRFELIDKPLPTFTPSKLIKTEDFIQINFDSNPVTNNNILISSRLKGDAQKNFSDGLHTFSILTENFKGNMWVEGSLEDNPTTTHGWFNISVNGIDDYFRFDDVSVLDVYNFEGNYVWIRFKLQPDMDNVGKIKKIWFKN